ncbi:MAG: winged helix-turn-helix transcriptional regulator [Nitrososphaera sp.]
MERSVLDKTDLDILAILGRDSRISYNSIGSQIGLTSKSVKARVKSMVRNGIIEKFIVRVNPAAFGYKTAHILARTNNGIAKDGVVQRVRQFGDLTYHAHQLGRNSGAGLLINDESWNHDAIQSLKDCLRPATVSNIAVTHSPVSMDPSETDLRMIKCLLQSGARMEIAEIAKELGISEKTATRRLDRMKEGRLLDFTLQCDPAAMIGYVQFCIIMFVAKSYYRSVYERMYSEFQESILYRPSVVDPDDRLIFVLFGENAVKVDSILTKIDSFEGVKSADAFIVTKLHFYDDWIMREVDKRLSSTSSPSRKLIREVDALKV